MNKNTLLYMSYGEDRYHRETMFSIMSALRFTDKNSSWQVVVYTDRPLAYDWLNVVVREISQDTLNKWSGQRGGYLFRRKIACILAELESFTGKIAFVDGDTYFKDSPRLLFDRIGLNRFCLHIPEIRLTRRAGTAGEILHSLFDQDLAKDAAGVPVKLHANEFMWNSGVIGLCSENRNEVEQALQLIDETWKFEKRLHTLEQFALGHIFSGCGHISPTDDVVFHYWDRRQRAPFLQRLPNLLDRAKELDLADAVNVIYQDRPVKSKLRIILGSVRGVLHKIGLNHRWTRTSY